MRAIITETEACVTAAAIALAPTANADGSDDNFLALLAQNGIPATSGIPGVISYGHKVCDALGGGESPSAVANQLAQYAYGEDPSAPLDRYRRTYVVFVRVASQAFCPGRAAAYRGGYHIVLTGLDAPAPPPVLQEVPDVGHLPPPVQVAKPKQTPPPVQKPPPPPEVVPPPSEGSQGGQGKGGTGSGIDGGGTTSGGSGQPPAPEPPEGHVALLP
jgi:uncharacterized membrane protein YgcG